MQMATAVEGRNGQMVVKRLSVPLGLEELMEGLTKEVISKKPKDIHSFASNHFSQLLDLRDDSCNKDIKKRKTEFIVKPVVQRPSIRNESHNTKPTPTKQLSRQMSIRPRSPMKKMTLTNNRTTTKKDPNANESKTKIDSKRKFKTIDVVDKNLKIEENRAKRSASTESLNKNNKKDQGKSRSPKKALARNAKSDEKKKEKMEARSKSLNEKSAIPKVSSVEEDNNYIKDGRLTVSPPRILKKTQTVTDTSELEPKNLIVPALGIVKSLTKGKDEEKSCHKIDKNERSHDDNHTKDSGEESSNFEASNQDMTEKNQEETQSLGKNVADNVKNENSESEDKQENKERSEEVSQSEFVPTPPEDLTKNDVSDEILNEPNESEMALSSPSKQSSMDQSSLSYDPDKLHLELIEADRESRLNDYTTSYNPYTLRNEIRNASADKDETSEESRAKDENSEEGDRAIGKEDLEETKLSTKEKIIKFVNEATAAIKIQSVWRGFKVRRFKKQEGVEEKEDPVNELDKQVMAVVKIQSLWRGFKARKMYKERHSAVFGKAIEPPIVAPEQLQCEDNADQSTTEDKMIEKKSTVVGNDIDDTSSTEHENQTLDRLQDIEEYEENEEIKKTNKDLTNDNENEPDIKVENSTAVSSSDKRLVSFEPEKKIETEIEGEQNEESVENVDSNIHYVGNPQKGAKDKNDTVDGDDKRSNDENKRSDKRTENSTSDEENSSVTKNQTGTEDSTDSNSKADRTDISNKEESNLEDMHKDEEATEIELKQNDEIDENGAATKIKENDVLGKPIENDIKEEKDVVDTKHDDDVNKDENATDIELKEKNEMDENVATSKKDVEVLGNAPGSDIKEEKDSIDNKPDDNYKEDENKFDDKNQLKHKGIKEEENDDVANEVKDTKNRKSIDIKEDASEASMKEEAEHGNDKTAGNENYVNTTDQSKSNDMNAETGQTDEAIKDLKLGDNVKENNEESNEGIHNNDINQSVDATEENEKNSESADKSAERGNLVAYGPNEKDLEETKEPILEEKQVNESTVDFSENDQKVSPESPQAENSLDINKENQDALEQSKHEDHKNEERIKTEEDTSKNHESESTQLTSDKNDNDTPKISGLKEKSVDKEENLIEENIKEKNITHQAGDEDEQADEHLDLTKANRNVLAKNSTEENQNENEELIKIEESDNRDVDNNEENGDLHALKENVDKESVSISNATPDMCRESNIKKEDSPENCDNDKLALNTKNVGEIIETTANEVDTSVTSQKSDETVIEITHEDSKMSNKTVDEVTERVDNLDAHKIDDNTQKSMQTKNTLENDDRKSPIDLKLLSESPNGAKDSDIDKQNENDNKDDEADKPNKSEETFEEKVEEGMSESSNLEEKNDKVGNKDSKKAQEKETLMKSTNENLLNEPSQTRSSMDKSEENSGENELSNEKQPEKESGEDKKVSKENEESEEASKGIIKKESNIDNASQGDNSPKDTVENSNISEIEIGNNSSNEDDTNMDKNNSNDLHETDVGDNKDDSIIQTGNQKQGTGKDSDDKIETENDNIVEGESLKDIGARTSSSTMLIDDDKLKTHIKTENQETEKVENSEDKEENKSTDVVVNENINASDNNESSEPEITIENDKTEISEYKEDKEEVNNDDNVEHYSPKATEENKEILPPINTVSDEVESGKDFDGKEEINNVDIVEDDSSKAKPESNIIETEGNVEDKEEINHDSVVEDSSSKTTENNTFTLPESETKTENDDKMTNKEETNSNVVEDDPSNVVHESEPLKKMSDEEIAKALIRLDKLQPPPGSPDIIRANEDIDDDTPKALTRSMTVDEPECIKKTVSHLNKSISLDRYDSPAGEVKKAKITELEEEIKKAASEIADNNNVEYENGEKVVDKNLKNTQEVIRSNPAVAMEKKSEEFVTDEGVVASPGDVLYETAPTRPVTTDQPLEEKQNETQETSSKSTSKSEEVKLVHSGEFHDSFTDRSSSFDQKVIKENYEDKVSDKNLELATSLGHSGEFHDTPFEESKPLESENNVDTVSGKKLETVTSLEHSGEFHDTPFEENKVIEEANSIDPISGKDTQIEESKRLSENELTSSMLNNKDEQLSNVGVKEDTPENEDHDLSSVKKTNAVLALDEKNENILKTESNEDSRVIPSIDSMNLQKEQSLEKEEEIADKNSTAYDPSKLRAEIEEATKQSAGKEESDNPSDKATEKGVFGSVENKNFIRNNNLAEDIAATKIQSTFRGHRVRRDLAVEEKVTKKLSQINEEDIEKIADKIEGDREKTASPDVIANDKFVRQSLAKKTSEIETGNDTTSANVEKRVAHLPLQHSGEFHDLIPVELETRQVEVDKLEKISDETNEGDKILNDTPKEDTNKLAAMGLQHSSEHHDSVMLSPLQDVAEKKPKINIPVEEKSENAEELEEKEKSRTGASPSQKINEESGTVQSNQAPAGDAIMTSHTSNASPSVSDSVEIANAHASDKDASECAGTSAPPDSDSDSTCAKFGMEAEKRNNASYGKKNMEAEAATKIQASFRGYQVRKQMKQKVGGGDMKGTRRISRRKSSGRITESGRISQAKNKASDIEEKSATKIQAGIRGFLVRRRQQKTKKPGNES